MNDRICIVGAGLVGSLLAILLKKKGFQVDVFEKRTDPRSAKIDEGRSINLALSHRGIQPLKEAGVFDRIEKTLIPMHGRMMHNEQGELSFQPYGKKGQFINSVSRAGLNKTLIEVATESGVEFHFEHQCDTIDFEKGIARFTNNTFYEAELIVGADGAFSAVRKKFQSSDRFNYSQHYIEHGYKELTINPINGDFGLEPNYLHIWPRGNFMLIALPNHDKTFTCTLFFPFEGPVSFEHLQTEPEVADFFQNYFPDVVELIPDLTAQFFRNPTSSLVTVRCEPWNKGKALLIGDAAHAIVPFYGQGMNCGFEDVRLLVEMAEELEFDWSQLVSKYAKERKKDADAISELALHNFIEMRDHVGDPGFLNRKKLEAELNERFSDQWLPLYSMVTFSDIPYSEAQEIGKLQTKVMDEYLRDSSLSHEEVIQRFNNLKKDAMKADR